MGTRTAARSKAKARRMNRSRGSQPLKQAAEVDTSDRQNGGGSATFPPAASCQAEPANCQAGFSPEGTSTVKQVAAAALVFGQNVRKTAQVLGVDRRTIQRWQKLDPVFQLAMAETKQEVVITSRQSLLAVAESAVAIVEAKLGQEQSARVALALLRSAGVLGQDALHTVPVPGQQLETEPNNNENGVQSATCDSSAESPELNEDGTAQPEFVEVDLPEAALADLLPEQQLAIEALFAGKSLAEAAETAVIAEATLRTWLADDWRFHRVLSDLQFDRICQLKHRLVALMRTAIHILRQAMADGDSRVALALVRGLGLIM